MAPFEGTDRVSGCFAIVGEQMEKNMENQMETAVRGVDLLWGSCLEAIFVAEEVPRHAKQISSNTERSIDTHLLNPKPKP